MGVIRELRQDLEQEAVRLLDEYRGLLMAEALQLCKGDAVAAEDLVMCTFERYIAKKEKFDPEKGELLPWLRRVMRNLHINGNRSKAHSMGVCVSNDDLALLQELHAVDRMTEEQVEANSDAEAVRAAIASLPETSRRIIMLRYFESLPFKEVAKIMGLSEMSVKRRLYYAQKLLASRLGKAIRKPVVAILAVLLLIGASFAAFKAVEYIAEAGTGDMGETTSPKALEEERAISTNEKEGISMNLKSAVAAVFAAVTMGTADAGEILYAAPEAKGLKDGSSPEDATTVTDAVEKIAEGTTAAWSEVRLESGSVDVPVVYDWSGFKDMTVVSTAKNYLKIVSSANDPRTVLIQGGGDAANTRAFYLSGSNQMLSGVTIRGFGRPENGGSAFASKYFSGATGVCASNCVFIANTGMKAGACYHGSYYDCKFIANTNTVKSGACWYSDPDDAQMGGGGGAICSAYVVARCEFSQNIGTPGSAMTSWLNYPLADSAFRTNSGVTVYNDTYSRLVTNCLFEGNNGAACRGGSLVDCRFIRNVGAPGDYAAVCLSSQGGATVAASSATKCLFLGNVGTNCGATCCYQVSKVKECKFAGNGIHESRWSAGSGATCCHQCTSVQDSEFVSNGLDDVAPDCPLINDAYLTTTVTNCLFATNGRSVARGTLYDCTFCDYVNTKPMTGGTYVRCLIANNRYARTHTSDRSAMPYACMSGVFDTCLVISNALLVTGNKAWNYLFGNNSVLRNCTVADNTATTNSSARASVVYPNPSCLQVNNVLWNPSLEYELDGNDMWGNIGQLFASNNVYRVSVNAFSANSANNEREEKCPFRAGTDDLHPWGYRLRRSSAAIGHSADRGFDENSIDFAGLPRVLDGAADAGCYEYLKATGLLLLVR